MTNEKLLHLNIAPDGTLVGHYRIHHTHYDHEPGVVDRVIPVPAEHTLETYARSLAAANQVRLYDLRNGLVDLTA